MHNIQLNCMVTFNQKKFIANLLEPIDISAPLNAGSQNIHAWFVPDMVIKPVVNETWIGDVNNGGSVNFRDICFNPHGHGTHTECVGHISSETYSINQCLKQFFFLSQVVSITPEAIGHDWVITSEQVQKLAFNNAAQALVIRTLPNTSEKLFKKYSGTNPAYIDAQAVSYLTGKGIKHLLVDLPSVDKEFDSGKLAAHHSFWEYPQNTQKHRTITELIYVPDSVLDGLYLLNLQIASFENDATPSKPILYKLFDYEAD